jgi:hypothetical protein
MAGKESEKLGQELANFLTKIPNVEKSAVETQPKVTVLADVVIDSRVQYKVPSNKKAEIGKVSTSKAKIDTTDSKESANKLSPGLQMINKAKEVLNALQQKTTTEISIEENSDKVILEELLGNWRYNETSPALTSDLAAYEAAALSFVKTSSGSRSSIEKILERNK